MKQQKMLHPYQFDKIKSSTLNMKRHILSPFTPLDKFILVNLHVYDNFRCQFVLLTNDTD